MFVEEYTSESYVQCYFDLDGVLSATIQLTYETFFIEVSQSDETLFELHKIVKYFCIIYIYIYIYMYMS